jgi:fused signal recognition particle receptor
MSNGLIYAVIAIVLVVIAVIVIVVIARNRRQSPDAPIVPAQRAGAGGVSDDDSQARAPSIDAAVGIDLLESGSADAELRQAIEDALVLDTDVDTDLEELAGLEIPEPSAGRLQRLRTRLARSNNALGKGLLALLSRDSIDDETWDEIEETLLVADLGVGPTMELVERLRTRPEHGSYCGDRSSWSPCSRARGGRQWHRQDHDNRQACSTPRSRRSHRRTRRG